MFTLVLTDDSFDEKTQRFTRRKIGSLELEHSLLSMSKWESIWKIPFIGTEKTSEQTLSYLSLCVLTPVFDRKLLTYVNDDNISDFNAYLDDPMTATVINDYRSSSPAKKSSTVTTSEIIYYYMLQYNIWKECELWPLNRLLTLIRVCSIKANTNNKMSEKDRQAYANRINEQRKRELNTKG